MKKFIPAIYLAFACFASSAAGAAEPLDQRIIGAWQGMRNQSGKCEFLAWNSNFAPDGRFEISFFADKERTQFIQMERGTWSAREGKNELKTDGVPTVEVYLYTMLDDNTIKYVNAVRDLSADCQADYEFVEHRVK